MKLSHFTISQRGDSHVRSGKNCQDYSGSISVTNQRLNTTFGIIAIADGVGSCDYSEYGSKIAVTTALETLKKELASIDNITDKGVLSIIKDAFTKANEEIEREADMRELPFKLFDTTLTVAVLTDTGVCYVGHIGDDGAVALMSDGTYSMITTRIEGEEANSVIPLSSTDYWTFAVVTKPVAALVLLTDGLLDKAVGSERMHNRVYYPFFKSLFENIMETEEDVADFRNSWDGYLCEKAFRNEYGITDDITLALMQIPSMLKKVKPVAFDEDKWNEDTEKAKQEIEDALSNNSKELPEVKNKLVPLDPIPAEKTTQPVKVSSANQQTANSADLHSTLNSHVSEAEPSQPKQRVAILTDNSNQNNSTKKKPLLILIPVVSLIVLLSYSHIIRKIGYDAGFVAGKQQEKTLLQEQLDELQLTHERQLKAEYDRGFHEAEISLAKETEEAENATQAQMILPEKYVIKRGQKGETVKTIQTKLISRGWSIKADGIYGELTEQAIREFQQVNALRVTGKVDILTFWSLLDVNSKGKEALSHDIEPSSSFPPDVPDKILRNPDLSNEMETPESPDTGAEAEGNEDFDKTEILLSADI